MKMFIIGGGFNGQLLHHLFPRARCFDWRPTPPKTAARQLGPQYLWEPIPGLGHRSFSVFTTIDGEEATKESILAYKRKVGKEQDSGDWRAQFQPKMTGYEPMLPPDRVEYGMRITKIDPISKNMHMAHGDVMHYDWILSTIPLDAMAQLVGIRRMEPPLVSRPIFVWTEEPLPDECSNEFMLVDYISDPSKLHYRETYRDRKWHLETLDASCIPNGAAANRILPGKIYHSDSAEAVREALLTHGIKTFGRFASWHPDELAHETFKLAAEWRQQNDF